MQLKKIFVSLLVVVVALSTLTFAAAAANTPSIDFAVSIEGTADADGNVVFEAGDTVEVVIDVHNNPGIALLEIELEYDSALLAPVDANKDGKFDKDDCTAGAFLDAKTYVFKAEDGLLGFKTSLAGTPTPIVDENGKVIKDGEIVKLSFEVLASAHAEEAEIALSKAIAIVFDDKTGNMTGATVNVTNGNYAVHDLDIVKGTPATCTTAGTTDGVTCKTCDYGEASTTIPALNHPAENREIIPAVPGNCTNPGTSAGEKCTLCGVIVVEPVKGDAVAHVPSGTWEVVTAATHLNTGLRQQKCANCSAVATTEVIPQIMKHNWVEGEKVAATCTTMGSVTYTCECGETKIEYVDALGHNFKDTVTAPTCTTMGYTTHVCNACEITVVDSYVDALGHKVVVDEAVAPSATADGKTIGMHCSECETVLHPQAVVPATGLTWLWILIVVVVLDAASCVITFFICKKNLGK